MWQLNLEPSLEWKPWQSELDAPAERTEEARPGAVPELVGASRALVEVLRQIELFSRSTSTVLIEGETGVGKELVARHLHDAGPRRNGPFVAVSASRLVESIFDNELFGHVPDAGTRWASGGLVAAAEGGTLFLDEVSELTLAAQSKLLHFLDHREVRPVGGGTPYRVDVRLLCATHRDLGAEVRRGSFRRDLYYRLRGLTLRVPPLRDRPEDVPVLVRHFLERFGRRFGRSIPGLEEETLVLLAAQPWHGNVRELENEIQRAAALSADDRRLAPEALSPHLRRQTVVHRPRRGSRLRLRSRELERRRIVDGLEQNDWNIAATARSLGLSRVGLSKRMKVLGLRRPGSGVNTSAS